MSVVPFAIDIGVVLREIADGYFVAPLHVAAIDRKLAVRVVDISGRVANQRLQQRGFARAVAARSARFFRRARRWP